ncbi:hypothetical protein DHEL01_v211246 [Diaporthe helianthi]|uniref:Uncharacterized protein n=1 Tax=Diaporthe helianthi TaxID=158607 RepID=A0A2P5HJD6_DIAHE|nr:hypothetical protein DHEL01_v211246 [Diaporthe helianthi]
MYNKDYISRFLTNGNETKSSKHGGSQRGPDSRYRDAPPSPAVPQNVHAQAGPRQEYNQMPQTAAAAPPIAPHRQNMSGQYMDSGEGMDPTGGRQQQQQQRHYPQHQPRGYQRSMRGSEIGEDEDAFEIEAQGYARAPPARGQAFDQGQDYPPPPNGQSMSSTSPHGSMGSAAGMYDRSRPPRPPTAAGMPPEDTGNMWAKANAGMGTPRPQRPSGPPSRGMHSGQGTTPLVQGMSNMSLVQYPRPPSHRLGDYDAGQQGPRRDDQFPGIHDDDNVPPSTPSFSTGYTASTHSTPVPQHPIGVPMNMPQLSKSIYMPQPQAFVSQLVLSEDDMDSLYDEEMMRYRPEMQRGPQGTFPQGYTSSHPEY